MPNELELLKQQLQNLLSTRKEQLIGFKCWDCEVEIEGLDITDEVYRNNPISITGYIMTFCEECSQIED